MSGAPMVSQNPSAIRTRAYRERQATGSKLITVEVPHAMIEAMTELGFLDASHQNDRAALEAAYGQMIGEALEQFMDRSR